MLDLSAGRWTFESESEFVETWSSRPSRRRSTSLPPSEQMVLNVAHFVAGHAMHEGFRLFKNGGIPLLEKRRGNRVFEIIFRAGGTGICGFHAPFTITAHVSDARLKLQRELYWKVPSMAPAIIATSQLDTLDIPPKWAIYDGASEHLGLEALSERVLLTIVPWFTMFIRPSAMLDRLRLQQIPRIERDVALELVILELGEDSAVEFLLEILDADEALRFAVTDEVRRLARANRPSTTLSGEQERLARIAARLGLMSRF